MIVFVVVTLAFAFGLAGLQRTLYAHETYRGDRTTAALLAFIEGLMPQRVTEMADRAAALGMPRSQKQGSASAAERAGWRNSEALGCGRSRGAAWVCGLRVLESLNPWADRGRSGG